MLNLKLNAMDQFNNQLDNILNEEYSIDKAKKLEMAVSYLIYSFKQYPKTYTFVILIFIFIMYKIYGLHNPNN